jgi:D-arabinose 1-dehydrogenase-like Zn-dependent alcohol dehydrogenase
MSDGAGDIVAIGEGVTRFQVGDRVAGIFFQDWLSGSITKEIMKSDLGGGIDGMLAEYVTLDQNGVVLLPNHLSYEEGATGANSVYREAVKQCMKRGAINVEGIIIANCGHFVPEEQPKALIDYILNFTKQKL